MNEVILEKEKLKQVIHDYEDYINDTKLELKNIRIKDGETLVLAGLIKENETQTVQKMPILSDLPFIGAFFRGNATTKSREELVIVVTPHIVKDGQDFSDDKIYDL